MKDKGSKGKIQQAGGPKRAGIIIRVSSAEQAVKKNAKTQEFEERFSPQTQERECREHCKQHGYVVVAVYYDIEKYRDANGRLVEPSGSRSDRPGLKQALADIDAGKIDVLVAWRQDRLVRGITRALIELKERVTQGKVEIELAKEQFNLATFEVLAWAAGVELQAKHDRLMMGVAGRLEQGKAWNIINPLGYHVVDGRFEVVPEEAKWVSHIWEWYADEVPTFEIRRRLIRAGAPQRRGVRTWRADYIRTILHHDYYHTGIFTYRWNGKSYSISCPTIVDAKTAERVHERLSRYHAYPAGNLKIEALVSGLIYCAACNVRMRSARKKTFRPKNGRVYWYNYYLCHNTFTRCAKPGCARTVRTDRIDAEVWEKVWNLISKPERFKQAIDARVAQLKAQEIDAESECKKLAKRLEELSIQRQMVITWARERRITEADLDTQLKVIDAQQAVLERELGDKQLLIGGKAERLKELAEIYREQVTAGAENINAQSKTPKQAKLQLEARRKIVERLVTRVDLKTDKSTEVRTEIDLLITPDAACSVYRVVSRDCTACQRSA